MELAMIGLGKTGLYMATRLARGGHRVVGYARTDATVQEAVKLGAEGAHSLEDVVSKLNAPRIIWVMVPAGQVTDDTIEKLSNLLSNGSLTVFVFTQNLGLDHSCLLTYGYILNPLLRTTGYFLGCTFICSIIQIRRLKFLAFRNVVHGKPIR